MPPGDASYVEFFLDRRGRPRLCRCAVLFVDLLGVRASALSARGAGAQLRKLNDALRTSARDFLRGDSPWPAAFFSDTLVVAAPFGTASEAGPALAGLLSQAAWLQWELSSRGFFLRGALTVDRLHLHDGLLFGPGLVNAYDLERAKAVYPRIVLGNPALDTIPAPHEPSTGGIDLSQTWDLRLDQDGEVFVDYLAAAIVDYVIDPAVEGLELHRDLVTEGLGANRRNRRVWDKYRWSAEYHNDVCERFFSDSPTLQVRAEDLTRRLEAVGRADR